jgi:hypothetical protein
MERAQPMSSRRRFSSLAALCLGLAAACSDTDEPSDDSAGANVYTGLPMEQTLASFDDDDAKAACEAIHVAAVELIPDRELVRSQCAAHAINSTRDYDREKGQVSVDVAMCDAFAAKCEADPASYSVTTEDARGDGDCSRAVANQHIQSCEATVAEYEACLSKILDQTKRALASITCENGKALSESDGAELRIEPEKIEACKLFLDECPDVQVAVVIGK